MAKLVFIGTGSGGFVGSERQNPSVYFDGILFDCGAGTNGRLYDLELLNKVEVILISHLHSDHISGIYDLLVQIAIDGSLNKTERAIEIFSPPGLSKLITDYVKTEAISSDLLKFANFKLHETESLDIKIKGKHIIGVKLDHLAFNLGYPIDNGKTKVAYSGDTRVPSAIEKLKTDYLIHEASFPEKYKDLAIKFGHSTAKDAAKTAVKMGAKRLFLTHLNNRSGPADEIESEAKEVFKNSIVVNDFNSFEI